MDSLLALFLTLADCILVEGRCTAGTSQFPLSSHNGAERNDNMVKR